MEIIIYDNDHFGGFNRTPRWAPSPPPDDRTLIDESWIATIGYFLVGDYLTVSANLGRELYTTYLT